MTFVPKPQLQFKNLRQNILDNYMTGNCALLSKFTGLRDNMLPSNLMISVLDNGSYSGGFFIKNYHSHFSSAWDTWKQAFMA